MTRNLILDPILAHLAKIWPHPHFFSLQVLPLLVVRQCSKLSSYAIWRKTNEPNLRKWQKKLILERILVCLAQIWPPQFFLQVLPLLVVRYCSKLSSYAISRKTNEPNWRKWQKKLVLGIILVYLAQIFFFFSKTWLRLSLNIMVTYHHVQYQKNLMIQSWENLERDGRTDRQMDQSDFTGRCPTNVEHPKIDKTKDRLLRKIRMRKTGRQTNEN